MTTPKRGLLFHFTHVRNLPSIVAHGLLSDSAVRANGALAVEVGEDRIKEQWRGRQVPIWPGGVVADYVPFYFAARSPMLYTICRGNVPAYQGGQDPLVYLVTEPTQLQQLGCRFVFTDRNAYYAMADYADDVRRLDDLVDWELMESKMWNNTEAEPDRMERRMAEFLVHGAVPFGAFIAVGVRSERMVDTVQRVLAALSAPPRVVVRRDWYFEGRP